MTLLGRHHALQFECPSEDGTSQGRQRREYSLFDDPAFIDDVDVAHVLDGRQTMSKYGHYHTSQPFDALLHVRLGWAYFYDTDAQ